MTNTRKKAMAIWAKTYGPETRAKDFAGREMEKDAYNDRSSEYSWNLDHVLPRSKGGKATKDNLVCCNMRTNDEKANFYPCFTANNICFRICREEGRSEIVECPLAQNVLQETVSAGTGTACCTQARTCA